MSFLEFVKLCAMQFFIITTCVNVAIAVMGTVLFPGATLEFSSFYSPLISGVLGTLPSIVLYSRKELNLKQTIIRRVLHLLLLEILLTLSGWMLKNITDLKGAAWFVLTVFVIYLAVNLITWVLESKDAKRINENLKLFQNRK